METYCIEVKCPENASERWGEALNLAFGGGKFGLEVTSETWWTDPERTRGSAYLHLHGADKNYRMLHKLSGVFAGIVYTNYPKDSVFEGDGFMVGLTEATLDREKKEIDEGGVVFVALRDIIGSLRFSPAQANHEQE